MGFSMDVDWLLNVLGYSFSLVTEWSLTPFITSFAFALMIVGSIVALSRAVFLPIALRGTRRAIFKESNSYRREVITDKD